jgi:hypothetical protein
LERHTLMQPREIVNKRSICSLISDVSLELEFSLNSSTKYRATFWHIRRPKSTSSRSKQLTVGILHPSTQREPNHI